MEDSTDNGPAGDGSLLKRSISSTFSHTNNGPVGMPKNVQQQLDMLKEQNAQLRVDMHRIQKVLTDRVQSLMMELDDIKKIRAGDAVEISRLRQLVMQLDAQAMIGNEGRILQKADILLMTQNYLNKLLSQQLHPNGDAREEVGTSCNIEPNNGSLVERLNIRQRNLPAEGIAPRIVIQEMELPWEQVEKATGRPNSWPHVLNGPRTLLVSSVRGPFNLQTPPQCKLFGPTIEVDPTDHLTGIP
ncbi:hypothetical protein Ciccas_003818 [Cichlidogyrus casuarinus]|uniref:Uncharacterized protein n=1 Tax=Cichlidogyrus casuarinus TaxID=1844966 RepID=A0ABD2QGM6_9PLAT